MPTVPSEFQFSIASHYWFGRGQWRGKTLCRRQNRFSHCPRSATLVVVKTLFDLQELVEAGADIFYHGAVSRFTDKPRLASHIPHCQKNSLHLSLRTQNLTSASSRVSSTSQRLLCQLFPWESNRSFWCLLEALEVLELSLLEGSKYTSLCCAVHEVMQWWWMIWCMTWCIMTI